MITSTRKIWTLVNPNSMFLISYIEVDYDENGNVCYARVLFAIRAFWIWRFLYKKKEKL